MLTCGYYCVLKATQAGLFHNPDQNIQKLVAYLNTNRVTYSREIGEYGSFQIEITRLIAVSFLP